MRIFALVLSMSLCLPSPANAGDSPPTPPDQAQIERALDYLSARRAEFKPTPFFNGPLLTGFVISVAGAALMLLPVATDRILASRQARGLPLWNWAIDLHAETRIVGPLFGSLAFISGQVATAVNLPFALARLPREKYNARWREFLDLPRDEQMRRLNADPKRAGRVVALAESIARIESDAAARGSRAN